MYLGKRFGTPKNYYLTKSGGKHEKGNNVGINTHFSTCGHGSNRIPEGCLVPWSRFGIGWLGWAVWSGGGDSGSISTGETLFRNSCSGCHTFGYGDHLGPDLANRRPRKGWVRGFLNDPANATTNTAYGGVLLDQWGYVMPNFNLSSEDIDNVLAFFFGGVVPLPHTNPVTLTEVEFEQTKDVYFNRCAGCHGLYRTGATGPEISEERSKWVGSDGLSALLRYGTPRGMPDFGKSDILSEDEITRLAAFLQLPPPEAPSLPLDEIQASWNLIVPVIERPTEPQHSRDWENFFGVVERDAGKITIFDGDTLETVVQVNVGFAVHILRSSASGRYFYAIGRDGLVTLIDLWASTPNVVATVKGCHDARSVDGSKFGNYKDNFLIEGCYWPPQYVVYNALTLEPLVRQDLPMESIEGETLKEVRVASIVSSHFEPLWVLSFKESGYVGLVDYSQEGFPLVKNIATERFLHDGGFDHTGRYFLVAANASNKIVVVDIEEKSFVASIETGATPHPGRGANWEDPLYGWVNATPHIGEPKVSVYGADPEHHPEHAWTVVREIELPSAGTLFLKTHPNSPWVLFDMTLSTDKDKQICAYSKENPTLKPERCFDVAQNGKAVHFEFNKDGSEVWVSDWASDGSVIVLDGITLNEIKRVPGLITPTGKFNVYNTAHDIY